MLTEARQSVHLVNATEGGGRIEGFEERPLRDVLSELPELGITGQSMAELAHAARPAITREHVAGWVGEQAVLTAEVGRAARRLRRVGVHALAAIRAQDASRIFKAFAALEEAEAATRLAVHAAPLVDLWAHGAVTETADDGSEPPGMDAKRDAERATLKGIRVAEAIERSASELRRKLLAIAARFEGQKPGPERNPRCP